MLIPASCGVHGPGDHAVAHASDRFFIRQTEGIRDHPQVGLWPGLIVECPSIGVAIVTHLVTQRSRYVAMVKSCCGWILDPLGISRSLNSMSAPRALNPSARGVLSLSWAWLDAPNVPVFI